MCKFNSDSLTLGRDSKAKGKAELENHSFVLVNWTLKVGWGVAQPCARVLSVDTDNTGAARLPGRQEVWIPASHRQLLILGGMVPLPAGQDLLLPISCCLSQEIKKVKYFILYFRFSGFSNVFSTSPHLLFSQWSSTIPSYKLSCDNLTSHGCKPLVCKIGTLMRNLKCTKILSWIF